MDYGRIKDPQLSVRLHAAADGNPHCPPMNAGRLTWTRQEMKRRFGVDVSLETVRKWFAGVSRPNADTLKRLAELLEVDALWLQFGESDNGAPVSASITKARSAAASGIVNVVAGIIALDGGTVAFGSSTDIDITAIINGKAHQFHVAPFEDGKIYVPRGYEKMTVLGALRDGMGVRIAVIPHDVIKAGIDHGGSIEIDMTDEAFKAREIEDFNSLR